MKRVFIFLYVLLIMSLCNDVFAYTSESYLILDDDNTWKYSNNIWYDTSSYQSDELFTVYVNGRTFGNYKLVNSEDGYKLYKDNQLVSYNGDLLAFSANSDIKVRNYDTKELSDNDIVNINTILNEELELADLSVKQKILIDVDDNGKMDEIVNVSSLDSPREHDTYYNLLYINFDDGNRQTIIKDEVVPEDYYNAPIYQIRYIIDYNNKHGSIIVKEGYFSSAGKTNNKLYELNSGKYELVQFRIMEENKTANVIKKIFGSLQERNTDYTMYYLLSGMVLIMCLIGLGIYIRIKNSENNMDV